MPTIKDPIPEAAIVRAHCDAIAALAAALKSVIAGDPTGDTAANALSAIRHSLDELEAYAEQRRQENSEQHDDTPYKHVYFRLDSGYEWGKGMDQDKAENFYSDILALFAAESWTIKEPYRSGSGATVTNGSSSLYIHPQEVSGYVTEELIPAVSAALEHGCTFKHYATDIYNTAYNWTAQQYRDYLNSKRGDINAGHQLALLVRAIRTDMAQQYQRDDKRRTSAAALRRLNNASVTKQGGIRSHFAGAFLDEQGRQCITDGFTLLRLNRPSTALQWAPQPNDPHVYDTIPELLNADGATVALTLPTAAEVRAKIASDRAKYKAESHPAGDKLSTCFSWGDGLPLVNALYLLDILEALPGCTTACRPDELSCVYFHSPDGDALIMPIRRHIANNPDEQEGQE